MKSFNFGKKASNPSKREIEDQRKKEDEQEAAQVFEEYVATFQESANAKSSKVWVKAGTYDAGRQKEDTKEKGKLYKPTSRFQAESNVSKSPESVRTMEEYRPDRLGKKKTNEKKKSNLEIFKEELKIIQEEREERHRLKKVLGLQEIIKLPPKPGDELRASLSLELDDVKMGSIDDGDPNTTNIYLGNLPTKISEHYLMETFGKFGPLASVKVMWPRTDEEKARNRLSGFVAFMSRRDGERALKHLAGKEIMNAEVKLGWGKAVPIPPFPIYIPPTMMELTMPPPPSGLPFNAQIDRKEKRALGEGGEKAKEEFERILASAIVKVVIPTDRTLIALIHRMIEFVTREGPMFEAMIMNREINNQQYRFLFENQGPAHIYYRWKLFSILQGDSTQRWRTEDFRMFKGGSLWRPPTLNPFTQGMPDELIPEEEREITMGTLSNAQRDRLERMLRTLIPSRYKISEVMIFSIEHSEASEEIIRVIKESLSNPKTSLAKKVARLYVISDVLHNCTQKGMNALGYRKGFKKELPSIFQEIHYALMTAGADEGSSGAQAFKERVEAVLGAWGQWNIYSQEFIGRLKDIIEGDRTANSREEESKILEGLEEEESDTSLYTKRRKSPPRATLPPKSALNLVRSLQSDQLEEEDLDGVPLELEDLIEEEVKKEEKGPPKGGFIPSKWETVDPEDVKAQAVTTTSKWDLFEDQQSDKGLGGSGSGGPEEEEEDIDGVEMDESDEEDLGGGFGWLGAQSGGVTSNVCNIGSGGQVEERRVGLREVELKVMQFQDEIESGRRKVRDEVGAKAEVDEYRGKLIKKLEKEKNRLVEEEERTKSRSHRRRSSPKSPQIRSSKTRSRARSPSSEEEPTRGRHRDHAVRTRTRSRSGERKRGGRRSRSRSRSPRGKRNEKHKR